jgi:DNA-binding MarR family transcriptional regulator
VLPETRLRETVQAAGPREHFAVPRDDDTLAEIERALSVLARRDVRRRIYERLAREAGIDLPALEAWTLARIHEGAPGPPAELARRIDVEPERLSVATAELVRRGLAQASDGWFVATPAGDELIERLVQLRRERLAARLTGCTPEEQERFARMIGGLARDLLAEPPHPQDESRAAAVSARG